MRHPNRFLQWSLLWLLTGAMGAAPTWGQSESSSSSEASSSSSSEAPIYATSTDRDNDLLVKAFTSIAKADEIQWLETPHEKFISLLKPGETRKTKGVLLIVHAPETPVLWPPSLDTLRRHLPLYGWATLALPVPSRDLPDVPARESSSSSGDSETSASSSAASSSASNAASTSSAELASSSASSSSSSSAIPRSDRISERVDAAVSLLNKNGLFNLVLLVDNSSAPDTVAALFPKINKATSNADTIDGPLQALLLVNLQDQEPLTKDQLKAIFAVGDLPVMDVFFNPDDLSQQELRRTHKAVAMQQNVKDYQQFIIPPEEMTDINNTTSFWLSKVRGFMEAKAEGNEVKAGDKSQPSLTEMK